MDRILNVLNKISSTRSINEKINILKNVEELTVQSLKYILNVTYDPYKVFNIGSASLKKLKRNKSVGSGSRTDIDNFVLFLECQIDKAGCSNSDLNELVSILSELRKDIAEFCFLILKKDLRIGMAAKTINKAIPNLIPEFDVQLCTLINDIPRGRYLVSPKLDGLRCIAIPQRDNYRLFSRNGRELYFPEISSVLNDYCGKTNLVFDGELMGSNWNDSMKISRKYNKDRSGLKYNIMDSIYLTEWESVESSSDPVLKRYNRLLDILSSFNSDWVKLIPHTMMDNEKDILNFYSYCLDTGFEGIILKEFLSCYEKRRTWLKMKPTETYDLTIVDCIEGTGKNESVLGSFAVNFNGIIVDVGSGMSDDQRKEFWDNKEKMLGKVIEVEADSVTKDGSLRFPRFRNLRKDKD
jgi:DNA ligase-1